VNRFLLREEPKPKDLFEKNKVKIDLVGGTASIDDSILDKPYSDPDKTELIQYHYSGKHKRTVKGICLITLYYTDKKGVCAPINYRVYNAKDKKSKNEYFREMLDEVLEWGLEPAWVTGDAWYSSLDNLKFIRKRGLRMFFGVAKDRKVSLEKGSRLVKLKNGQKMGWVWILNDVNFHK